MDRHAAFDEVKNPNSWQILREHKNLAGRPLKPGVRRFKSPHYSYDKNTKNMALKKLKHEIPLSIQINGKDIFIGLLICDPEKKEVFVKFEYKDNSGYMQFENDVENGVIRTLIDHVSFHKNGRIHFKHIEPSKDEKQNIVGLAKRKKDLYQRIKINPDSRNPFDINPGVLSPFFIISIEGKDLEKNPIFGYRKPFTNWVTNPNQTRCSLLFWAINDYLMLFKEGLNSFNETFESLGMLYPQYEPLLIPSAFETSPITMGTGVGTSILVTFMLDIHMDHKKKNNTEDSNFELDEIPLYFYAAPTIEEVIESYSLLGEEDRKKQIESIYSSMKTENYPNNY